MGTPAQVSQLVLQVDANIAVAQRSLQQLARAVQQSSNDMNSSIDTTVQRHNRLNGAFNQARLAQMELGHVIRASVDDYAAGASPIRIMTMEIGRLAEAAELMGGGTGALGKLASFMQGGWGIAVMLGVNVLAQLVSKFAQGGDSVSALVDKMREQAKQAEATRQADIVWANSIDGLIDRNEKLIDTLQKRLKAEEDLDLQDLKGAQRDESKAQQQLADAKTKLANLQAQQAAQTRAAASGGGGTAAGTATYIAGNLDKQIAQAQQDVATAQKAVTVARQAITESSIAVGQDEGKALADLGAAADLWSKRYISAVHGIISANHNALAGSTDTITAGFYALEKSMKDAASAGITAQFYNARTQAKNLGNELQAGKLTAQQYTDKMKALAASLTAAAEAAKNAKKGTGEIGKQISFADAEAIAKGAGLTVTSGYRSVADQARLYNDPRYNHPGNPVAKPGQSAHNGLNGRWALDIAFAPGISAQSLKKLYGDQGVTLSAVYKESGHFHIEGSTSHATAAQKAADRAAQKQKTDDDQFAKESAQLDAETLAARKQLVSGYDTQTQYASDEIEAQRKAAQDAIQKRLDAHQISVDQAKALSLQADDLAAAKDAVVARQQYVRGLEQAGQALDQSYQFQLDDVKFADSIATTQAERRKLQLELLDIQYQQKAADLERLKKTIESNKDFATSIDLQNQAKLVQGQIDHLPTEKAHDQKGVELGTMDPLQAWMHQVPHDAAMINEALQSIEVQGIDNLASGIADVITGTKSLGQVFRDISSQIVGDIIQMTVKMLIFRAISGIFGGGSQVGGGGGSFVMGGGTNAFLGLSPRAAGGPVAAGQSYVVGDRGFPELFVPSTNGVVMPNVPRINLSAANNNQSGPIEVHVMVDTSEDLLVKAAVVADQRIQTHAPKIVQAAAKTTVSALSRRTLNRG